MIREKGVLWTIDSNTMSVLILKMKNGMTTHLTLYEGGYVRFGGVPSVCVRMDTDIFRELTGILAVND